MEPNVRWVGFDMDECIGNVMPLWFPVHNIHDTLDWERFVERELKTKTWLLNPVFIIVLGTLYTRYTMKELEGAFIFSNNGSQELVEILVHVINLLVQKLHELDAPPSFCKVGFSAASPCRAGFGKERKYEKSFEIIQHCLSASGLRPCSSVKDLLFFDDQVHVLKRDIGAHYCQVTAYTRVCSSRNVLESLVNYEMVDYEMEEIATTHTEMKTYERKLIAMGYSSNWMFHEERKEEYDHWWSYLVTFFPTKGGSRKRSRSRSRRGKQRKQVRAKSLRKKTRRG
jgi:hypothetical protein